MAVKMNMIQQIAIGFFILCMLPLCTQLGIKTFLQEPEYQKQGWALEQGYRNVFYKKNNIEPKSLQGSKDNKEIQTRWQATEDAWKKSDQYAEYRIAEKAANNSQYAAYQINVSFIHYTLALLCILLSYLFIFPIIASSCLLTTALFINISFYYSLRVQGNAWVGFLMYSFILMLLLWIAMRRRDACQVEQ